MTRGTEPDATALAWARDVAVHVPAGRMADKTPCTEWDVRELLGHLVTTVDRALVVGEGGDPNPMPRVVTGIADDGWADAVAGCGGVLHVASPFPPEQPKDPDELIVPARDGALRVIEASLAAGVERIVMTSSVAAVRHGRPASADKPYAEEDWTDGDDTRRTP